MKESLKDALTRAAAALRRAGRDLPAIERRARGRRARRYAVTGLVAVVATAAIALPLFALSRIGSPPAGAANESEQVSESMMLTKTPGVLCTASMPAEVAPGAPLGLTMSLENITDTTVKVSLFQPAFPVRVIAGDGMTWDTADLMAHSWPGVLPTPLASGLSKMVELQPLRIQFPGPLTVTPSCAGEPMPALHADVAKPGPTPADGDAVSRAVSATSGLFDGCSPTPIGSAVGLVSPPDDSAPSLQVRCAAEVRTFPGFVVVTLVMSTPSTAASPTVPDGLLLSPNLASQSVNAQTLAWRFVVTATTVHPVASATHDVTKPAGAMDTVYEVLSTGWRPGGTSRCGSEDFSAGGDGRSVFIVFYEACM